MCSILGSEFAVYHLPFLMLLGAEFLNTNIIVNLGSFAQCQGERQW